MQRTVGLLSEVADGSLGRRVQRDYTVKTRCQGNQKNPHPGPLVASRTEVGEWVGGPCELGTKVWVLYRLSPSRYTQGSVLTFCI